MSNIKNEINGFETIPALLHGMSFIAQKRLISWVEENCSLQSDRTIMTATIVDLKCPACGNIMGQKEYERVVANLARVVEEKSNGVIQQIRYECDKIACSYRMKIRYETLDRVSKRGGSD